MEVATLVPLFQVNLLPDFTHVYFMPFETSVAPALVHLAPAFASAKEEGRFVSVNSVTTRAIRIFFMM